MLKPAPVPMEARALGNIKVRNLHGPSGIRVLSRDQAGNGALAGSSFLTRRYDPNCHIPRHVA
jgi:hypothetical protein